MEEHCLSDVKSNFCKILYFFSVILLLFWSIISTVIIPFSLDIKQNPNSYAAETNVISSGLAPWKLISLLESFSIKTSWFIIILIKKCSAASFVLLKGIPPIWVELLEPLVFCKNLKILLLGKLSLTFEVLNLDKFVQILVDSLNEPFFFEVAERLKGGFCIPKKLLYVSKVTLSLLLFDDSSKRFVKIEQPLKTISFLVRVPVLSLKIYLTNPNSSSSPVLKHFILSSFSSLYSGLYCCRYIVWKTLLTALEIIILIGMNVLYIRKLLAIIFNISK